MQLPQLQHRKPTRPLRKKEEELRQLKLPSMRLN